MKITFRTCSRLLNLLFGEQIIRTVNIEENKDGYWRRRSQRDLISALRDTKGIEVEDPMKVLECKPAEKFNDWKRLDDAVLGISEKRFDRECLAEYGKRMETDGQ